MHFFNLREVTKSHHPLAFSPTISIDIHKGEKVLSTNRAIKLRADPIYRVLPQSLDPLVHSGSRKSDLPADIRVGGADIKIEQVSGIGLIGLHTDTAFSRLQLQHTTHT